MRTGIAGRVGAAAARFVSRAALLLGGGAVGVSPLIAGGLASLKLSSYYQPETVQVSPVEKPWLLPLDWQRVVNAGEATAAFKLSSNAWAAIERNGFAVVPYGPATNIIEAYALLRQAEFPLFVTSDSLLHLYHVQFDEILKGAETNEFFPKLATLTSTLLDDSLAQRDSFTGELREAATRNAAFLAVAAQLLGRSPDLPAEVSALADAELALIAAHAGFSASPIFKYQEDYSQYVPRGHYTRSDTLMQYFKAMMWYGRLAFLLKGSDNFGPTGEALVSPQDARIQTFQASLLALALGRLQAEGKPIADTWNRIYAVTAFFVGLADDLTPCQYQDALEQVFGPGLNPEDIADEAKLFLFKAELASLPSPEIYGGTGNCQVPPNATPEDLERVLDKTKGMRVMGQRFVPDSFMFQRLVVPVTGPFVGSGHPFTMEVTQGGPRRCFPRGLDLMAVLGSKLALNLLDREGDTSYVGYDVSLNDLVDRFASFGAEAWHRNLYWAWLYALRPLLSPGSFGEPCFMQTPAWRAKQLNTALASWVELRHDTILYAKQSNTPVVTGVPQPPDPGYVEPVPEFYQRLLGLTRMTRLGLDDLKVLDTVQRERLLALEDILGRLRDIAIAELESKPLTAPQRAFLLSFDEALAPLTNGIPGGLDSSTTLVADVHTDGNTSQVLEEGVGFIHLILVAYPTPDGRLVLATGPVLSYYEFKWPAGDRLTDERWVELLAGGQPPGSPAWVGAFAEPVSLPPADSDGDRLPDEWERTYWGGTGLVNDRTADFDSDGLSNEQEAIASTDPTDPASALRLLAIRGQTGMLELQWASVPGLIYRVSCSEDLRNWRPLGVPVAAAGRTVSLSAPSTNTPSARFFRLEVVP